MSGARAAVALAGAAFCLAWLEGCSGAGRSAEDVRGADAEGTASDHLSAVTLVRSWLAVLYPHQPGSADAQVRLAACVPTVEMEDLGEGRLRLWGRNSDCSTFDWVLEADGSGSGTQTWPDGTTKTSTWGTVVWSDTGLQMNQQLDDLYSDGTRIRYTISADLAVPEAPQTWDGDAVLADGRAMRFTVHRASLGEDHLLLTLPDGSRLEIHVPLTWTPGAAFWPVFSAGGNGEYRSGRGTQQTFRLTGEGDAWERWEFTSSDGFSGEFVLGEGLAGNGSIWRGGDTVAALRWVAGGGGTLYQVAAAVVDVTPSAAAQAFQVDQWIHTIAALAPCPMY